MEIPYTASARPDTGLYNAKIGIWLFLASEVMLFGALFSTYIVLRVGAPETGFATWPMGSDYLNIPIGTFNTAVLIISSITILWAWSRLIIEKNLQKFRFWMGVTVACGALFLGIKSFEYREKFTHYELQLANGTIVTGHIKGVVLKDGPTIKNFFSLVPVNEGNITYKKETVTIDHINFIPDAPKKSRKVGGHAEDSHAAGGHAQAHEPIKYAGTEVKRISSLGPWRSPFFAIYFTLTGLHALHVFGGMIMNTYLCTVGTKMWKTDPTRFTNRVETSGLFWHFVDLVWIFLFPVLYLL
jgi:cytochrome c oxidase subunit III